MLGLLLGVLGIGGAGALALRIFGFGAIKATARRIPPKVWLILAVVAVVVGAFFLHRHIAHKALTAAHDAGYAEGVRDNEAAHVAAQAKANERAEKINSKIRSKSDEDVRAINRDADVVLLRGPGKAVCPGLAAAPGAAGGHGAASGAGDAAVGEVPDPERAELIALPFAGTIAFANQCDVNRSEVLSWRESDSQQRAPDGSAPR